MDESVSIPTPDNVSLEFELAGLGSRFCAYLIDSLIISAMIIALGLALLFAGGAPAGLLKDALREASAWVTSWNIALVLFLAFAAYWGYYVFFEGLQRGATPGKKKMGIRVIREDGLPIGLREAALRNLVRAADMLPPPCYLLGGVVAQFDRYGRRLGDMVAGTLVVVERFDVGAADASGAAWAARVEQGRSRQAVTLPQGTLSASQIALVEQFIARRQSLPAERRAALAWQIVEPLLPLFGEDKSALENSADREALAERMLLEILALARGAPAKQKPGAASSRQPALF
ncbi:MAG TPA: RDD family protein [Candidatus Acidoferrales bacterium]|nr:RDD family protein [Candidatus Acidoferrales bacterium]